MKVNVLAIVAHPDDAELCCSGTLLRHKELGYSIGVVDLTRGELGSRGNDKIREQEAKKASEILNLSIRYNLNLGDGTFENNAQTRLAIISQIRRFQPDVVITNTKSDRHPDHGRAGKLVADSCFYSGLIKVQSQWEGQLQEAWRPKQVWHMTQDNYHTPDIVFDITKYWPKKIESILAFSSQFYDESEGEQKIKTPISGKDFLDFIEARAREMGRFIQVEYAEGFVRSRPMGTNSFFDLL